MIPDEFKVLFGAGIIIALLVGYFSWQTHERNIGAAAQFAVDNRAIQEQKDEAAAILAEETAKAQAIQTAFQSFMDAQGVQDEKNSQTVVALNAALRKRGRLRDPYSTVRRGAGGSGAGASTAGTASNCADNGSQAGGLFSDGATAFFLDRAVEADGINLAYASCRAWAYEVKRRF